MIPTDFDFGVLDDPSFKEDAVREEIVAPILRHLGYRPSGKVRVERSKTLLHPFVMIGTKKHKVHIVPDYTLYSGNRPILILDAKAPNEDISTSLHVQQVYSYAIHPEIRCEHFGLCNGRELVVFEVATLEPVLRINCSEINARWQEVQMALGPQFLEKPILRKFDPDYGIFLKRAGVDLSDTALCNFHINLIAKVSDDLYSVQSGCEVGGQDYMATFDIPASLMPQVLSCVPTAKRTEVEMALRRNPFTVYVGGKMKFDVGAALGPFTPSEHEVFVPLLVSTVIAATYQPDFVYPGRQTDVPSYIYRL